MARGVYFHKPENYPPSRKGIKQTEETKAKIRASCLAAKCGSWMTGRKDSAETRLKKSINSPRHRLGLKLGPISEAHKEALRTKLKGHFVSERTRERMGNINKGKFAHEHPGWKEIKKRPLYKAIREIFKYKKWRKDVFTRDKFSCVLCGISKVYVEADHYPVRFVDILKKNMIGTIGGAIKCAELWDIGNGRTLCKPCHLQTITWGRKS